MPMDQPEMERRIVRNTNDILAIYDLLSGMDATLAKHTIQLANIQHRQEAHEVKLAEHDARFDAIDGRLDAIDGRLDAIDGRLDAIDGRLSGHDDRFDRLDTNIAEILRRLPA